MKFTSIVSAAIVLATLSGLAACGKREEPIGPAQKAGAAIDNAGDKVAEKLQENINKANQAGEKIQDAAKATGDRINEATQDASKGIDRATEEVGKKVEKAGEKIQESARPK
jgi:F0F1-type ATP synthase membrane subunit b/b'